MGKPIGRLSLVDIVVDSFSLAFARSFSHSSNAMIPVFLAIRLTRRLIASINCGGNKSNKPDTTAKVDQDNVLAGLQARCATMAPSTVSSKALDESVPPVAAAA